MALRSAIYFNNAPRPVPPSPLSCRHSSIRQFHFLPRSFSSVSHRASALALSRLPFFPPFFPFSHFLPPPHPTPPRAFVSPLPPSREYRGIARARAPRRGRLRSIGAIRQIDSVRLPARQDSRTGAREVVRTDWEPKWIFPGIPGASCIRNNINGSRFLCPPLSPSPPPPSPLRPAPPRRLREIISFRRLVNSSRAKNPTRRNLTQKYVAHSARETAIPVMCSLSHGIAWRGSVDRAGLAARRQPPPRPLPPPPSRRFLRIRKSEEAMSRA